MEDSTDANLPKILLKFEEFDRLTAIEAKYIEIEKKYLDIEKKLRILEIEKQSAKLPSKNILEDQNSLNQTGKGEDLLPTKAGNFIKSKF